MPFEQSLSKLETFNSQPPLGLIRETTLPKKVLCDNFDSANLQTTYLYTIKALITYVPISLSEPERHSSEPSILNVDR